MHTGVVDEGVDVAWTGLDLLESLLDRLVTGEIELEGFDGVGRVRTFLAEALDRGFGLLRRTTAEENVVGLVGLQEGLNGLVANAIVAAGDENDLWGRHCCSLLSVRRVVGFGVSFVE